LFQFPVSGGSAEVQAAGWFIMPICRNSLAVSGVQDRRHAAPALCLMERFTV
jgi:hypothetical protein